jgi:hypothetical protein
LKDLPARFDLRLSGSTVTALKDEHLEELGELTGGTVFVKMLQEGKKEILKLRAAGGPNVVVSSHLD